VLYACTILRFVTIVTDWRVLWYMMNARKQRSHALRLHLHLL
jgi:hypothetical protein